MPQTQRVEYGIPELQQEPLNQYRGRFAGSSLWRKMPSVCARTANTSGGKRLETKRGELRGRLGGGSMGPRSQHHPNPHQLQPQLRRKIRGSFIEPYLGSGRQPSTLTLQSFGSLQSHGCRFFWESRTKECTYSDLP